MAQQRVFMGSVISAIKVSGGDETHPIYVRDNRAYTIDQVADSIHSDVTDKIGTETIGSPDLPVYIKDGVPTPIDPPFSNGDSADILLGDGTSQTIEEFITGNIEIIREALGIVTREKMGLVPKLPSPE